MSTQTEERIVEETLSAEELALDMVVSLFIGEGKLDRYLKLVGDRKGPLIKYHDGSLTLVSPSMPHERDNDYIDGLIKAVCAELEIDLFAFASTLFRKPGRDHGIEADQSYYIANAPAIRGHVRSIDLAVDPPPDLIVEAVYANSPKKSLRICQELGVPEVWVYRVKKRSLEFLHLGADGKYVSHTSSRSFPFLKPGDVIPWLGPGEEEPYNRWERRLRAWVRAELLPRHRPAGGAV